MKRWFAEVGPHATVTEAQRFWWAFDQLPEPSRVELLPNVREVAAASFLGPEVGRGWRHGALVRLGSLQDRASIELLRRTLNDGRAWPLQAVAASALGALRATEAAADLERVSKTHWSRWVRLHAANAALQVAGEPGREFDWRDVYDRDPRDPDVLAPTLEETGLGWRRHAPYSVVLDGARVEFEPLDIGSPTLPRSLESRDLAAELPAEEGIASWRADLTAAERTRGGWVLGTDSGEFGGAAMFVPDDGPARVLIAHNVVGAITWNDARYLLLGLGHMGSDGFLVRVEDGPEGLHLTRVLELPEAPYRVALAGDRLLQATRSGVAVVSPSFELDMLPYATARPQPEPLPEGYEAAMRAHLAEHHDALQRCVQPLAGLTAGCEGRPPGLGLWFDIESTGVLAEVVPFAASEDRYSRPASPEVAACLRQVAASWTFPPFESGWTTLGVTFEPGAR